MAKFITLTDVAGLPELVNADHITRVWERGEGGSRVSFLDGEDTVAYRETPAEIDAMLGVTESGEAIAAALEAEADRMDDDATAIHNGTMRGDMKLRAKAFRDAAKIARAARGE